MYSEQLKAFFQFHPELKQKPFQLPTRPHMILLPSQHVFLTLASLKTSFLFKKLQF